MFTAHSKCKTASQAAGMMFLFGAIVKGQQKQKKKLLEDIPKLEKKMKRPKGT